MLKQSEIASINPVARILPVLAVETIGSIRQEMGDRATQLVKGKEYLAHVLAKVGGTTYNVKVESSGFKGAVLKMDLGTAANVGQTLNLRYIHDSPVPTFMLASSLLKSNPTVSEGTNTELSPAANLLGQYLQQAESDGVNTRVQATTVVSHSPANPQVMAQDLKNAIIHSGLFYESHLSDFVQGNQTLTDIKQEPQNQSNTTIANLLSQQLSVLENQRISWHGEVWPGQTMDWDIEQQQKNEDGHQAEGDSQEAKTSPISSDLTLHLPNLGKVSARISLVDGRMRVNIHADQVGTLELLKAKRLTLAQAITKNGQQLDALTVVPHD